MTWWIWIVGGIALLAFELAIPGGIIFLFFGVSAIVVGTLVALDIGGPLWLQTVIFAVMSIVSTLTLRGPILRRMAASTGDSASIDAIVGQEAVTAEEIIPGAEGKVELRGASWTAQNVGTEALAAGHRCTVERVDGLKLYVR
ncbi:MAG: NfeD family protein [Acidobacteriota bacterium]|nr:NfeD family protein [Acidobacteriota bacterium]MDH3786335.1 NfeD family protein [Acidobacteriota bacterium]